MPNARSITARIRRMTAGSSIWIALGGETYIVQCWKSGSNGSRRYDLFRLAGRAGKVWLAEFGTATGCARWIVE